MKIRLTLIICLALNFLSACQSLLSTPTTTPAATATYTLTATATLTLTSTTTPLPTATKVLTLEEKYGHLVPVDENVVLSKAGQFFIGDPQIPAGTKYTELQFRATGESRVEQTSLGQVAMVHLVYRNRSGKLQDLWMWYAGYNFGPNKSGANMIQFVEGNTTYAKVAAPDDLLGLVCPGVSIIVDVAWQKGPKKDIAEKCFSDTCNEMFRQSSNRIPENSATLKLLVEGNGVASEGFRLVPMYFRIVPGVLAKLPNGFGWEFAAGGNTGCNEGWTALNQITNLQVKEGN